MSPTRPILAALLALLTTIPAAGAQPSRDGHRDFDFEFGSWRTHLLVRAPLDSAAPWREYVGTSIVRPLMDGRANVVELAVAGSAGRIEGLSFRLYDPQAFQWSLNFSNIRTGTLAAPVFGRFEGGRGTFIGLESEAGRAVLVRFEIEVLTTDSVRFVQSYSADHGRSWIQNWIATDTRTTVPGARLSNPGDEAISGSRADDVPGDVLSRRRRGGGTGSP